MLGSGYSLLLCVCSYCTCTSLFHKLSISAPSSLSARLFGCMALMCSSVMLRAFFYARRPLLAISVRVQLLHMNLSFS
jgi:hypothetical protein